MFVTVFAVRVLRWLTCWKSLSYGLMLVTVFAMRVLRWLTCWKDAVLRSHVGGCVCSESVEMVDLLEGRCHMVSLPINIHSLSMTSLFDWVITESHTHR